MTAQKGTIVNPWVSDSGTKLAVTDCDICGKDKVLAEYGPHGWICSQCAAEKAQAVIQPVQTRVVPAPNSLGMGESMR